MGAEAASLVRNHRAEIWVRLSSTVEGEIRTTGRINLLETRGLLIELNRYLCPPGPGMSAYERLTALFQASLEFLRASVPERDVRYFIVSNTTMLVETYAPIQGASARSGRFRVPNPADERLLSILVPSLASGSDAVFAGATDEERNRLAALGLLVVEEEIPGAARAEPESDPWLTSRSR